MSVSEEFAKLVKDAASFIKEDLPSGYTLEVSKEVQAFFLKAQKQELPPQQPVQQTAPKLQAIAPKPVPKPAPVQEKKAPKENIAPPVLEPIDEEEHADFSDIKDFFRDHFPNLKICALPAESFGEICLLSTPASNQEHIFLKNLAQAIEIRWGLKTSICRKMPQGLNTVKVFLSDASAEPPPGQPAIPLEPLSSYLQNPEKKRILWETIHKFLCS